MMGDEKSNFDLLPFVWMIKNGGQNLKIRKWEQVHNQFVIITKNYIYNWIHNLSFIYWIWKWGRRCGKVLVNDVWGFLIKISRVFIRENFIPNKNVVAFLPRKKILVCFVCFHFLSKKQEFLMINNDINILIWSVCFILITSP